MDLVESTMNRKAKLVYLDPRFTVTAAKADEWYPIRPGTDLAFILALLHVILGEERYDREFVATHCLGFEELRAHVAPYTPSGPRPRPRSRRPTSPASPASSPTPLPARCTTRAAARPGTRTTSRCAGRRRSSTPSSAAGTARGAWCPTPRSRSASCCSCPGTTRSRARVDEIDTRFPLAAKGDGVFLQARENVLAGTPYPVKGWMVYKQDPMNALPDRARTLQMIEKMDFVGVVDTQLSDTAWYADVVFPESTYLERLDPLHMLPGIWPVVVMRQQVVPPIHDTKPNLEIMQGLASRLGLADYFDYTIEDWVEAQAKELPGRQPARLPQAARRLRRPRGRRSTARPGGPTTASLPRPARSSSFPSASPSSGHDPLPVYTAPVQPPAGSFRMVLGRKATHTHAATTNNDWLPELDGANNLWLNPQPAAALGIVNGDLVEVSERRRQGPAAGPGHRGDPARLRVHAARLRQAVAGAARAPPRGACDADVLDHRHGTGCPATRPSTRPSSACAGWRWTVRERLGIKAKRYALAVDTRKCIHCMACVVACKAENDVPLERFRNRVHADTRGEFPHLSATFEPEQCHHCASPSCVRVCPTGASYQREDGLVLVDGDDCIGCGYCIIACPYDARFFNEDTRHRRQVHDVRPPGRCAASAPACVETCPTRVRTFGDLDGPGRRTPPPARHPAQPGQEARDRQRPAALLPGLGGAAMDEPRWGLLIIAYLFLGGLSAGLFFVSALATYLQGDARAQRTRGSRSSAPCWLRGRCRSAPRCWSSTSATGTASTSCS